MSSLTNLSKDELIREVEKLRSKIYKNNNMNGLNWQKIVDSLSNIILLVDKKGKILKYNKAARKYFKLSNNNTNYDFWELVSTVKGLKNEINLDITRRQSKEVKLNNKHYKITVQPIRDDDKKDIIENIIIINDITERKNYIREIEERKDKFEDLVELANVAIASDDRNGNLVYFNKQFADLFGYTVEEIMGLSHKELIHPDDQEIVKHIHELRFKKNKTISRYEFRGIKKDGSTVYIDISVSEIIESDGKVVGTRSYLRDITEKKLNEWRINEQVKKIKCLQNIANLSSQKDIEIDEYFSQLTSILPLAFQQPDLTSCYIKYKTKEFISDNYQKTNNCIEINLNLRRKAVGKIVICYLGKFTSKVNYFTQEESDLLNTVSLKITDFLERAHSELIQRVQFNIANAVSTSENVEKFLRVVRNELGLLIDTSNFYVAFYDKYTNMCSCPYMDDEKDDIDTWPADRSATGYLIRQAKPVLLKKKDFLKLSLQGEFEIIGTLSEVWLGVPLKVGKEIIGAFVVQSYDNPNAYDEDDMEMLEFVSHQLSISIERKKAFEDLEKALEKARESDRLKSAFLTNMSHEIRTPMNGILGFTKLLAQDDINEDKRKKYLEIIDKNSKQLLSIIGDILDISKIETGQIEAFNQRLHLYDFITKLYEFYKPNFEDKNIDFSLKLNFTDNSLEIITDEGKLNQIISNLLSNALKFTKEGSVELGCMIKPGNLTFYVKDSGIGIDKSFHDKIFDRFRQAELEITRQYEGNGLGLAITKGFVELLGGDIWLESEPGKGSTFYFTIKLNIFRSNEITNMLNIGTSRFMGDKKCKVLVVDDDDESCLYLSELLSKYSDYETIVLNSGIEAINYINKNGDIDIVLLDIKMPELDGYETAAKIKAIRPGLTIIAQTAYAFYNDRQKAIDVGFDDYLAKPILPEDLMKMLRKHQA